MLKSNNLKIFALMATLGSLSTLAFASDNDSVQSIRIKMSTGALTLGNLEVSVPYPVTTWICRGKFNSYSNVTPTPTDSIKIQGPYDDDNRSTCKDNKLSYIENGYSREVSPYFVIKNFDIGFSDGNNKYNCHITTELGLAYFKTGIIFGPDYQNVLVTSDSQWHECGTQANGYKYRVVPGELDIMDKDLFDLGWIEIQPDYN